MNCKNCKYFVPSTVKQINPSEATLRWMAENHGECRRHAPVAFAYRCGTDMEAYDGWPTTKAANFCGDFEAKEATNGN